MRRRTSIGVLAITHIGAAGAGFYLAPRHPPLAPVVKQSGVFQVDVSKVIELTVQSLRAENKLVVLTFSGNVKVRTERTSYWILHGTQDLLVPGSASYLIDMSKLTSDDVSYDPVKKRLDVRLPEPVLSDVAFQPEKAQAINGGVLTYNEGQVEALRRLNFAEARRAFVAKAQDPRLVNTARRNAMADIRTNFGVPLAALGRTDISVNASFR